MMSKKLLTTLIYYCHEILDLIFHIFHIRYFEPGIRLSMGGGGVSATSNADCMLCSPIMTTNEKLHVTRW
jgi:hypothetical protein